MGEQAIAVQRAQRPVRHLVVSNATAEQVADAGLQLSTAGVAELDRIGR